MDDDDLKFANDAQGAIESNSSTTAWITLLVIAAMMISAIVWAGIAEIEQTTSGQGKIIPSSQVQVVESLDSGIVAEIFVSEGDQVTALQPLLRVDDTGLSARLGEFRQKQISLRVELARLRAEAGNQKEFAAPDVTLKALRSTYQDQMKIFKVNQTRLKELSTARQQQFIQKQQSLEELIANIGKHKGRLELLNKELAILEGLRKKKAIAEIEVLRIRRKVLENKFDLKLLSASRSRVEAEVAELKGMLDSDQTSFLSDVHARISRINTELSVVEESIRAASDRVARAILRAPVGGIVNQLNIANIGEIVKAGVTIAEIVPIDDKYLVEARIRPQDIGFISPGLPATIRLSAYDYTKYGTLKGQVERIGVDTITDENKETFYQVIITTDTEQSNGYKSTLRIIPGMIASIDIATGRRTVLDYLLKPFLRIGDRALRDPS
jgi:adhesin transport system membrane fusion protein